MKIGIDISQLAYHNTGVSNYLLNFVTNLINSDHKNEYVLFYSSLRSSVQISILKGLNPNSRVKIKQFRMPPTLLDLLWNKLHIIPIESFIGEIDVFITSDWTEPPVRKAKKATILYDLIIYKYPQETHEKIIAVQKRKLQWVKKESTAVFCISEATKQDAKEILHLDEKKLYVAYPGGIV